MSRIYLHHYENNNHNSKVNGEWWLLHKLQSKGHLNECFDVGANSGDWAALALKANPKLSLHCFEVIPATRSKLIRQFAGLPNVKVLEYGLSDQRATIKLNVSKSNDKLSSIHPVLCANDTEVVEAEVISGREYLLSQGISKIDFLKVDVEGAEMLVFKGFGEFLEPDKIPVIQFEYGYVSVFTKDLLKDFYELLVSKGYRVGKLFPNSIRFKDYSPTDEDFMGPNYIAMSQEVIADLKLG